MEFERIKKYLQKEEEEEEDDDDDEHTKLDQIPFRFFDPFVISSLCVDLIDPDRGLCSFNLLLRLVDAASNTLHGGAIAMLTDLMGSTVVAAAGIRPTGVSFEINFSCIDHALATVLSLPPSPPLSLSLWACA
uniref:Thioesterase domain-containing protein n=2 Tax=Opuntia streptacantha TaxID=393608 RepID=A0A7C8YQQ6_OPUST